MQRYSIPLLAWLGLSTLFFASVAAAPATQPSIDKKCDALLAKWKPRLDAERFGYTVSAPFVIAGDGGDAAVTRYRDGTILPSARAMQKMYFDAEPTEPILILLFESEGPYRRLGLEWFGDRDVPHFGFFRPHDRAMLMNVATGTGTLVHELTHALMAPDFPTVPDWFNEGLASLYEQSTFADGTIKGLPNWRLPALQRAIRAGELRSTEQLIADPDFRSPQRVGINYAHARYLMLYFQEHGQLRQFYRSFRDHAQDDPTGAVTFKQMIAPQTVDAFDGEWKKWVLSLRFP
jgi:hypothetical protein